MPIPQVLITVGGFLSEVAKRVLSDQTIINAASSRVSDVLGKILTPSNTPKLLVAETQSLHNQERREQELIDIQKKLTAIELAAREQLQQSNEAANVQRKQTERTLELREQEFQILRDGQTEKLKLSHLYLQILQQNKQVEIDLHLSKIQADWDHQNWSGVLSRTEMRQILIEGRKKHRLLMLVSPPDIDGSNEFDSNLHGAVRGELRHFMEKNYPIDSDLCPVEFYGRFFKRAVFDIELKQYEKDLEPIPTVVIYSDVTDEKIYFYVHCWGMANSGSLTFPWNWLEERNRLETEENKTREESRIIVRDAVVKLHQLLAAFWVDLYYLQVNPHHEIRLFQLNEEFPEEWTNTQFEALKNLQQQRLKSYRSSLMNLQKSNLNLSDSLPQVKQEITICFLGKTGSGKSTLINAFYNWCLGVDGKSNKQRKYCISTRSQEGNKLEAEKQFEYLNTENLQRAKGASSTKFPSRYTFETDDLILHVVDTPGFADTDGITKDREHIKQILEKITQLNQVHIFGIVWHEKRLTKEQKYIVGCLQELLPKNSHKNIVVCVTNTLEVDADTRDAIVAAGLEECPLVCFDNLWVTAENWSRVSLMFRNEAEASFGELIQYTKDAKPVSSVVFQSIKRKRQQLEDNRIQIFGNIATLNARKRALKVALRELEDLTKDISNITVTYTKIKPIETPAIWNTICSICVSNCHIECGLRFKTQDYSGCNAMKSDGFCRKCGHHHSVHTHQCTKWNREEIKEELIDSVNLKKKQSMEEELKIREEIKQDRKNEISSLDSQIDEQVKELRLVIDELSSLVMAPFNPHYLDYLETLKEAANQNGDVDIAEKFEHEIKDYKSFIELVKSGFRSVSDFLNPFS
jgi:GTP-binding protein EngB required for normal cell division